MTWHYMLCRQTQRRLELAAEIVRFDTVRLLSLRVCEILCLCQQTTNNSWAQGGDSTCHWRNWAAIMRKCHRKFRQKSKSVPAESWGTFVGYCVPQLIAVRVLYTEIKISALLASLDTHVHRHYRWRNRAQGQTPSSVLLQLQYDRRSQSQIKLHKIWVIYFWDLIGTVGCNYSAIPLFFHVVSTTTEAFI